MIVNAIKTPKIRASKSLITDVIDRALPTVPQGSIIAIASKIVALCEGRVAPGNTPKDDLIIQEADLFLPRSPENKNWMLTIAQNHLSPASGIDASNADDQFILWPSDPQISANSIRQHLAKRVKNVGVVITDSTSLPLQRGVQGMALAYSGFEAFVDYRGQDDIFGRKMHITRANVAAGFAAAAVLAMGEGSEQTPIAVITDVPKVQFIDRNPNDDELRLWRVGMEEDIYAPLFKNVQWQQGGKG